MAILNITKMAVRRKQLGISQSEMAEHLGITQTTYMRYETGQSTPQKASMGGLIAERLNMPVDEVFEMLELEKPQLEYKKQLHGIPFLKDVVDNQIVVDNYSEIEFLDKKSLIDDREYLAIKMPHDFHNVKKGSTLICSIPTKSEKLFIDSLIVVEQEIKIKRLHIIQEIEVVRKVYTTCVLRKIAKNVLIVDDVSAKNKKIEHQNGNVYYQVILIKPNLV